MTVSFQPVFLWTDLFFWGLCVTVGALTLLPKPQYIREGWWHVGRSKLGMAAAVIILCYISVALLDSVHFKSIVSRDGKHYIDNNVKTLLDRVLSPIDESSEMTFSSPFSDHLFIFVAQADESGRISWQKPMLHDVKASSYEHIPSMVLQGIGGGILAWVALNVLIILLMKGNIQAYRKLYLQTDLDVKWRTALITALCAFIFMGVLVLLSHHFHILGTDKIGQDVFYQTLKSVRTGVIIGTVTTLVLLPFAIFLGTLAGYTRGWVDDLIQYLYTTLSSIPSILLIAASVLMLDLWISGNPELVASETKRGDLRLISLCVILGLTSWTSLCRLLRGETLKLREQDYVMAAISQGVGRSTIIRTHILPNLMHIVFITVVLDFSALILTEAVLSYVGVGVDPSTYSWGTMINSARLELSREPVIWWSIVAAFLFMATLVLSANLFSDVVQKAFDPRARGR